MQKVIDKIIERLEKLKEYEANGDCPKDGMCSKKPYECTSCYSSMAIEIVKEVAEEFAADINVGNKTKYIQSSERVCDLVDKIFSHNEVVALWKEEKGEISYHKLLWRGMAWDIPEEYKTCKFVKIFGTIPESITEADTVNIEIVFENDVDSVAKIKTNFAEILIRTISEKPYYEIMYFDFADREWHIGFGSYNLDYVAEWKRDCFEIVDKAEEFCEWKTSGTNDNWTPSCEPNSTYNVFGIAWFRRCPYCGRKIKVVEND